MAQRTIPAIELLSLKGQALGTTDWIEVTQERVNQFAEATNDRQWIHTDPARAAKESPYRRTIAHGFFTLSLVPSCLLELLEIIHARLIINCGIDKVRWPGPVPIPARIRMSAEVTDVTKTESVFTVVVHVAFEVKGQQKPAMDAEVHYRVYAAQPRASRKGRDAQREVP